MRYLEFEVTLVGESAVPEDGSLVEVEPHLWRRLLLADSVSFEVLHRAIQMACGWEGAHLYEFSDGNGKCIAGAERLAEEENAPKATSVPLTSYFTLQGRECLYVYDFGDNWQHRVKLVQEVDSAEQFVQRLKGGEGMFPPEDCGGIPGYYECLRTYQLTPAQINQLDPVEKENVQASRAWLGNWRPDGFDLETVKRSFDR